MDSISDYRGKCIYERVKLNKNRWGSWFERYCSKHHMFLCRETCRQCSDHQQTKKEGEPWKIRHL